MIAQAELINELQSLQTQRADALAMLHRIDGAEQVIRHLLAKSAQAEQEAAKAALPSVEPSSEAPNTGPRPEVAAALNGEVKS